MIPIKQNYQMVLHSNAANYPAGDSASQDPISDLKCSSSKGINWHLQFSKRAGGIPSFFSVHLKNIQKNRFDSSANQNSFSGISMDSVEHKNNEGSITRKERETAMTLLGGRHNVVLFSVKTNATSVIWIWNAPERSNCKPAKLS